MRYELADYEWAAIKPMLPNKPRGVPRVNDRRVLNGIFWVLRSGAPWRDLPEEFGKWNSVFKRFRRWAKKGVWKRLFTELGENPDLEYLIIDSTIVRAHQHAAGAQKGEAKMRRSGVRAAA